MIKTLNALCEKIIDKYPDLVDEDKISKLARKNMRTEVLMYRFQLYLVLLPSFLIILINADAYYLALPALIGIITDYFCSLSKKFWLLSSIVTIPASVLIYWILGQVLSYAQITFPGTASLSLETILYGLIFTRFIMHFICDGGIVANYANLIEKEEH